MATHDQHHQRHEADLEQFKGIQADLAAALCDISEDSDDYTRSTRFNIETALSSIQVAIDQLEQFLKSNPLYPRPTKGPTQP